ncbi:MAG TPA: VCBS repeat-containing protein, partial [Planctomycetaceae bacterium]|nr:VCBS repeat-containing protein [Planctomycetaceae bacterium]
MLYLGCRIVRDYEQKNDPDVLPHLIEALETAPQNAVLILTLLREMAAESDPRFLETLERNRDVFLMFTSRTSQQVPRLIEEAEQSAREEDWETVNTRLRQIGTVLLGEVTYTQDLARLDPHSLEWIRHDFSDKLYETYPELRAVSDNRIEIRFEKRSLKLDQNGAVRAIYSEDFDLDGRRDLIYATDKSLFVVAFDADGTPKQILETDLPFEVSGIRTADLDRDFVRIDPNVEKEPASEDSAGSFRDTDLDVMLYGEAGLRLYRNDLAESGARSLVAVPQPEGIDLLEQVVAVEAVDLDHDGDLDLVVSSQAGITLWSNRGNWSFENISKYSN